jgi:hypothetical protein
MTQRETIRAQGGRYVAEAKRERLASSESAEEIVGLLGDFD